MNLKSLAGKLQQGLACKGIHVRINQHQHYSDEKGRMVTKYVVQRETRVGGVKKVTAIVETYQMSEVVAALARLLGDGGDA